MIQVMIVDDERIILEGETAIVKEVIPGANIASFRSAQEAMTYAASQRVDIAFLDINLVETSGLQLAKNLQETHPEVNIIFCTGYSEYALDAYSLYASAYLLKPISEEAVKDAVSHLRFPLSEQHRRVSVRCFGNFEVYCDGVPVKFKYIKTKEFLAVLIDRKGSLLSTHELMAFLFGDEDKGSYVRNLKADLVATFQHLGVEEVLFQQKGLIGIRKDQLECDYYDYLNGQTELFHGEYMMQYSFGEETMALLMDSMG